MNIDELMRKIHADVARRRPGAAASSPAFAAPGVSTVPVIEGDPTGPWEPVGARLGFKDTYTVGDFVALNDVDFVHTAYRILLRRPADPAGLAAAVTDLRHGVRNKIQVLGDIRFSVEGRERCVHVDGLLLPYKIQQWSRRRIIGRPLAWVLAVARLPKLLARLDAEQARGAQEVQNLGHHLNALGRRVGDDVMGAAEKQREVVRQVQLALEVVSAQGQVQASRLDELDRQRGELAMLFTALDGRMSSQAHDHASIAAHLASVDTAIRAATAGIASAGSMAADARRIALTMQATAAVSQATPSSGSTDPVAETSKLDALYVGLEDAFRGSREDIKQRVAHYLPTILQVVRHAGAPVVDLGCGRGEWLEVLDEAGVDAQGVDLNTVLLSECTGRGFNAVHADALAFLRVQPTASLSAVTAMHLAEHLPFEVLVGIIDEARRVLVPGGALVLETPNPENLLMSTQWFYLDPTHKNPIPPAFFEWLVQARGFVDVRIDRLIENRGIYTAEPVPSDAPGAGTVNRMLDLLQAAPDYAIVARSFDPATAGHEDASTS